ncbi:hypothetical protein DMR07_06150 [Citrobacter freundii]|uniref:ead/Ea22-like family protein n=1 Tax=Citrobacter freundii TaxID=546 RepID=UPI000D74B912|nr:ead/Ea22-like family protein [Citrobacter freundii]PXH05013.1 hypothetical protein DMR07_06150 [Citrobacter freundii]
MTALNKQALRERYSEKPAPKCHICGSVMTIQRAGAGSVVYGCTGRIDGDGEGYKFEAGRNFADDHYARSRVTEYGPGGDPDVLALLDELEASEKRIAELRDWNAGLAQESFTYQQRVAELESRTVTVKLPADYRNSDGSINADMFNTCAVVGAFRDALAAAGIGVKGE